MVQMNRTLSTSQFKRLSVLILSKGEASLRLFTISACEKKKEKETFPSGVPGIIWQTM